ncbi:MAG: dTDP-4-dehydrorhamnose reductase [Saprospiraceae bacterium]|nr:dTDP-4-dehydrorhamnose reductase [Saprospiraceae bacterium]
MAKGNTRILVTGANGQVGQEIQSLKNKFSNYHFYFTDREQLDIGNKEEVQTYFAQHKFDYCINCAAYTAVDKAEEEKDRAYTVNVTGAENLALACHIQGTRLIHLSTDYVYHNDEQNQPFREEDETSPKGIYAATKLEGEQKAQAACQQTMIVRTSWVYSSFGHNFVKTMLRLGTKLPKLTVIFDQIGTPTYANDLAATLLNIIQQVEEAPEKLKDFSQVYHYSNEGVCSWFDFAKSIFHFNNIDCHVTPIETKDYPTAAARPHFSLLNKAKIKKVWGIEIPYWKDSLAVCLQRLQE